MSIPKTFQYYQIRPCIRVRDGVISFFDPDPEHPDNQPTPSWNATIAAEDALYHSTYVFWSLYGFDQDGNALRIGEFDSYEDALAVQNAILEPLARARYALQVGAAYEDWMIGDDLDDIINQSSNGDRL